MAGEQIVSSNVDVGEVLLLSRILFSLFKCWLFNSTSKLVSLIIFLVFSLFKLKNDSVSLS